MIEFTKKNEPIEYFSQRNINYSFKFHKSFSFLYEQQLKLSQIELNMKNLGKVCDDVSIKEIQLKYASFSYLTYIVSV